MMDRRFPFKTDAEDVGSLEPRSPPFVPVMLFQTRTEDNQTDESP